MSVDEVAITTSTTKTGMVVLSYIVAVASKFGMPFALSSYWPISKYHRYAVG